MVCPAFEIVLSQGLALIPKDSLTSATVANWMQRWVRSYGTVQYGRRRCGYPLASIGEGVKIKGEDGGL
jgi:hypothetical protein